MLEKPGRGVWDLAGGGKWRWGGRGERGGEGGQGGGRGGVEEEEGEGGVEDEGV